MDQGFKHLAKVAKILPNLVTLILMRRYFFIANDDGSFILLRDI